MKLTFNFRAGIAPLTLDLDGDAEEVLDQIKAAIKKGEVVDFTDKAGERVVIPADAIAYVMLPAKAPAPVGFGRM